MNKPQIICDKCQKNLPLSESDISHDTRFGRKISPMELKFIIIHIKSCGADSFTMKHNNQIQKMTPENIVVSLEEIEKFEDAWAIRKL